MPFAVLDLRVSADKFPVIVCDGETFLFVDSPDKQKTQSLRPLRLCGELSEPSSALICENLRLVYLLRPWRPLRLCASHGPRESACVCG